MSDRTPPPNGRGGRPAEGTPEYDWLYGSRGSAPDDDATEVIPTQGSQPGRQPGSSQPSGPDATRVLPTVSAGGGSQGPRQPNQAPHQTPPPPPPRPAAGAGGAGGSGGGSGRTSWRPRPRFRVGWLKYVVILWLVFLIATPIWAWTKISKVDAFPDGDRPEDQPGTTYLMVGSDSRSDDTEGTRTDTIMLLHTGDGPNLLMSIPRDSIVEVPGHGETKINAAYAYGGASLLIQTIEKNTGIRVDDYVEIGFTGFKDVVDALGGIEVCPKEDAKDEKAHLDIKKGCQEVNGDTALAYSRARHAFATGDIARAQHQREVVSAVGKKALSPWTVINPIRWWRFNSAAADSVNISDGTGPIALGSFAIAMTRVNGDDGLTCVVPIADLAVNWDQERSKQMFDYIIDDNTQAIEDHKDQLCTTKGLPE